MSATTPLYNLQICRALAAIMVLLAHATHILDKLLLKGLWLGGWCGVDFFFVLSGFIIYYTNFRHLGDSTQLLPYFKKRVIRIFPIHWLYLVVLLLGHFALQAVLHRPAITWIPLDAWGYFVSFSLYPTSLATTVDELMPFNPVSYTLAYELLFYAVFAFAFLLPRRYFVLPFLIWLGLVGLGAAGVLPSGDFYFLSHLCATRNIEFFYGAAIAFALLHRPAWLGERMRLLSSAILGLGLLLLGAVWYFWLYGGAEYKFLKVHSFFFYGVPFALIVWGVVGLENGERGGWLKRTFVYLGDASYSIYLFHYLPIVALSILLPAMGIERSIIKFAIVVSLLIPLTTLLYRYVEKPLTAALMRRFVKKGG